MTEKLQRRFAATGNFDGVHSGHKLFINELKKRSKELGLTPTIFTFSNHPLSLVAPERAPGMLMSTERKVEELNLLGVETVLMPFDDNIRMLSAYEYMKMLHDRYGVCAMMIGHDNTFGHDREATYSDFEKYGDELDIKIYAAPCLPGVSSSDVRKAVKAGDMELAHTLLGRYYELEGNVEHGRHLGTCIGFPTVNLCIDSSRLLPLPGVYAAKAILCNSEIYPAVVNIGSRPTVEKTIAPIKTEAHLIGFSGDLYDTNVIIQLVSFIRNERKMSSLDELKAAIKADCASACSILEK